MFKIQSEENKTVSWPVNVEVAADGGKIAKYQFTGTFRLLSDDEREAMADPVALPDAGDNAAVESGTPVAGAWKETMIDQIMKVMTGWKEVVGEDGQPIAFNRENLRAAARGPRGVGVLRAINTAITEISTGARSKN
jgi:hypothetical protein